MRTEPQAPVFERNCHKGKGSIFLCLNGLGKVRLGYIGWLVALHDKGIAFISMVESGWGLDIGKIERSNDIW